MIVKKKGMDQEEMIDVKVALSALAYTGVYRSEIFSSMRACKLTDLSEHGAAQVGAGTPFSHDKRILSLTEPPSDDFASYTRARSQLQLQW